MSAPPKDKTKRFYTCKRCSRQYAHYASTAHESGMCHICRNKPEVKKLERQTSALKACNQLLDYCETHGTPAGRLFQEIVQKAQHATGRTLGLPAPVTITAAEVVKEKSVAVTPAEVAELVGSGDDNTTVEPTVEQPVESNSGSDAEVAGAGEVNLDHEPVPAVLTLDEADAVAKTSPLKHVPVEESPVEKLNRLKQELKAKG